MRVGSLKGIVTGLIVGFGFQVFAQTDTLVDKNEVDVLPDSVTYQTDSLTDNTHELVDVDKLDSLAFQTFFGDFVAIQDTNILNIYGFEADEIPQYDDSVFIQRFEDLNRQTPIEFVYNKVVRNYINLYGYKNRKLTSKMLGLAKYYFPLFEEYLDKYDLPLELKYLAIVESALNPTAGSRAGAKGLWQFMYGTGRMYGLKSNSLVDDRYDPIKATEAACQHLQDLYDIYEDWSLALAAYNSGTGNVNKAIRRAGKIKSYWAVWPYLPRETRGYVPGFFGVAYVMQYAAEHNLYPEHPGFLYHQIDTVTVTDVLSFEQISEFLDISEKDLKTLNPAYKKKIIPATKDKPYVLHLPHHLIGAFSVCFFDFKRDFSSF